MAAPLDAPNMSAAAPDVEALGAWMQWMITAARFAELIKLIVSLFLRMRALNTELLRQVTNFRRQRPPSETLRRLERQLALAFPDVVKKAAPSAADGEGKPKRNRAKQSGRDALPAHLRRIDQPNPVPASMRICPLCGAEMKTVNHDACETLDIIPAELVVRRRIDETVACPNDDTIVSAPVPPELVPRGKLAQGLIVESLLDKYVEHHPLERQCTRWARSGVVIASQTLGRSVAVAIDTLAPIAALIAARTRASAMLSADATGLRVLDRNHAAGVRTGTVWCWIGDARWVTFVFAAHGDAEGFKSFLSGELARTIQCDGTNLTNCIELAGGKRPGCWSHARRRFVAAAKSGDLDALEGLRIIRRLFAVDRLSAMKGENAEERKARRLEYSAPVLEELAEWERVKRGDAVPPKTPFGDALGYLRRQWKRLVLFLEDGRIELTNNHVEREIRRLVLGRKNWLFVEGDLNGERAASILTIVATCIAQGINPRAYIHLVTKLIVEKWPRARYEELLPSALAAQHVELRLSATTRKALPRAR